MNLEIHYLYFQNVYFSDYDQKVTVGDPLELNIPAVGDDVVYCKFTPPNPLNGKAEEIIAIHEIINGTEKDFVPARDSTWKYKWMEVSINRCHIKILSTVGNDNGTWEIRAGIDGEITQSVLIQGMYPPT